MELQKQVVSLQQAIRLNNLGVDLTSQFSWCWNGAKMDGEERKDFFLNLDGFKDVWPEAYNAFTVAELGVMLPEVFGEHNHVIRSYRPNPEWVKGMKYPLNQWVCEWGDACVHEAAFQPTEAEARADMLIWLLENNHTTAEEVNERLKNA